MEATREAACRCGLTLVETVAMVCVGIAMLSVIIPALGETRRRGKDTVCIQNLHRIIQASHIYAGRDPNESIIPAAGIEDPDNPVSQLSIFSQLVVYAYGGKSGVGTDQGTESIRTSPFGPSLKLGAVDRPLNRILFSRQFARVNPRPGGGGIKWLPDSRLELSVYHCPSDSGYTGLHINTGWRSSHLTSYDHFGTSYAANVFWIRFSTSPPLLGSISPYLRPMSRVPNPARTVAYMENNGRSAWRAEPENCPAGVSSLPGICGGWHGKDWSFNTAFVDGSVSMIRMRGYHPEPPGNVINPDMLQCISVRGLNWQLDTLPAPTIQTVHPAHVMDDRTP